MKKFFAILSALVLSAFAYSAKAQLNNIEGMPPYKLGVTVGLNIPDFSGSDSGISSTSSLKPRYTPTVGFQIGANLMVDASPLLENTFGRVELKYTQKGASWESLVGEETRNVTLHYLEIPIHYGYAWYINDMVTVMAEAGPYFSLGLGGTHQYNYEGKHDEVKVFSTMDSNRFDCGVGLQASVMLAKYYQLHMSYDFGFININSNYLQNRNFSIGFTWFFEHMFE